MALMTDLLEVRRYSPEMKTAWDAFVRLSKNGTFLFLRDYMDYHRGRFDDHSLMIMGGKDVLALLPAHRTADAVHSHFGLTYGGLVVAPSMSMRMMRDVFESMMQGLRNWGVTELTYKTVPHIYHRQPAEEDRDLLYRHGAQLIRRNIFTVLDLRERLPVQQRRMRGAKTAMRAGVIVEESTRWTAYWDVLCERLAASYQAQPVHTPGEITELAAVFPRNIRLFTANEGERILAGIVIYETDQVVRLQYIAASDRGRDLCALDLLVVHLLDVVYPDKRFADFGSSNDASNEDINLGLVDFKEGFGGRSVAHDWYRIDLSADHGR